MEVIPLLQGAHFCRQRRLITHGRRHPAQQRRHLRAGLGKAENVVNKQRHILVLNVPEVLGHGEARQAHPHSGSGWLIHLAIDQGGLGQNAGLFHFIVQVIALPGALAHTGEDRNTAMLFGDVVDELHDEHRFAHSRAAKEANLAALGIGANQVHHLDAGLQNLRGAGLGLIRGGPGDEWASVQLPWEQALIDGLAQQVEHPAQAPISHRDGNRRAGVCRGDTPLKAVSRAHGDGPDHVVTQMLGNFRHNGGLAIGHFNGVQQLRQASLRKTDIQHGADHLNHSTDIFGHRGQLLASGPVRLLHLPRSR